ncbi:glycosyltransferase family 4 protein [Spirosoma radiotolerans]|uniref:Glycosyl transferase family 1 n=1 Tax=Spirosoma radiotolerans TaxID=1379870 RepID=A0A0E3ZR72_9BACT|nr:glycosyltransferase family 1 protein [Spirosoma radiotolerans]AKD53614.1 hypothetical protein SD10_00540 [Spirosoma radiotolerans]
MVGKVFVVDARMILNSGIGIYIENFVKGLANTGKYSIVLLGSEKELSSVFDNNHYYKIIDIDVPIYSILEQLYLPFVVPKCDIFWSPHYNIPLLPIRAKKRLVTIHDTYHITFGNTLGPFKRLYAKLMLKIAVALSDIVFTVSEFSRSEIYRHVNTKKNIISIYNGIDLNKFSINNNSHIVYKVREKLSLPHKYILFVGNVKPNKNIVRLLLAFKKLISKDFNYCLVIVGKKEGFINGDEEVFDLLKNDEILSSRVTFTGYVDIMDLPILYQSAAVLAFPSIYEGFGLPPLEAMACGCPVIVSSTSSLPEVCGEKAALYINPLEVDSIADGLQSVLLNENIRKQLILEGSLRCKEFSWSKSVSKFIVSIER